MVILDNGHGEETAGKRSPIWGDGTQLFEFEFNRTVVNLIYRELNYLKIPCKILVPEAADIPLSERVRRAKALKEQHGGDMTLISVHGNAGGGTGWEAFSGRNDKESGKVVDMFYESAERFFSPEWRIRTGDGQKGKTAGFYIFKVGFPSILTENFFMDTERDCKFMQSDEGRFQIALMHVDAIKKL